MTSTDTASKQVKITAISLEDAAKVLASAYGRQITEQQVRQVAKEGELLSADGTINLLAYAAFIVQAMGKGGEPAHDEPA